VGVQKIDLLTSQADVAEFLQYVVGSRSGFSKMETNRGGEISPICCIVVLSLLFPFCICHE